MRPHLRKPLFGTLLLGLSVGLYAAAHGFQDEQAPAAPGLHFSESASYKTAMERLEQRLARYPDDPEASLLKGILQFKAGRAGEALAELDRLTERAPRFHLAHLVRGDLLLAQTGAITDIGAAPILGAEPQSLAGLREEAEARLKAYLDSLPGDRVPRSLLAMADGVSTAIVVDKSNHRLYVYRRTELSEPPQLVRDFYVSTGKIIGNKSLRGDLRTPEGVYFVTGHIPQSRLPDKYGVSAYPVNYPNELDARLGKTGDGIWLHGTERAYYSRPPLDSEGCVVLPNPDVVALAQYITPGVTPVIITEHVVWLTREEWQAARDDVMTALEAWRVDWESGDVERYLSHYADGFWSEDFNVRSWAARKRQVALGKRFQQVKLSNLSAFAYPETAADGREVVVINLRQSYRSNNFNGDMDKRLYLARENGSWRVLYEGSR